MQNTSEDRDARAQHAIKHFLEHVGFDIIEQDWSNGSNHFDFIAYDDCCLVFVDSVVYHSKELCFPMMSLDREEHEHAALVYLSTHDNVGSGPIRFDCVELIAMNETRAFIRFRKNVLGSGD
ncbi:MAG: hypothetical protein IJ125_04975 [Atopobiaceae bacterium]|nr:hypothetical protein [Atopobiaceae bacterium]